jgi:hypothetical protein
MRTGPPLKKPVIARLTPHHAACTASLGAACTAACTAVGAAAQTVMRTGPPLKKPVVTARLTAVTSSSTRTSRPVYQNVRLLLDFCGNDKGMTEGGGENEV